MEKRLTVILFTLCSVLLLAQTPKQEFRAAYITTAWSIDWPYQLTVTTPGNATQIAAQKAKLTALLDRAKQGNMNAVLFQVRSFCDAMYNSAYEPWSRALTGTQGVNPGYDPLAFAITEAHKRGLELHAWINPYRVANITPNRSSYIQNSWILTHTENDSQYFLDPGNPNVQAYVLKVIKDILTKYDIDGIAFDDYFYNQMPKSEQVTNETVMTSANNPNNLSLGDWRRENITSFVKSVYQSIASSGKPWVRFGIAPPGIWSATPHRVYPEDRSSYLNIQPVYGVSGYFSYDDVYFDGVTCLYRGILDYISPQIYRPSLSTSPAYSASTNYNNLCAWWGSIAKRFGRHFFSSNDVVNNDGGRFNPPADIQNQIDVNGNNSCIGAVFYNSRYFFNMYSHNSYFANSSEGYHTNLSQNKYASKALPPAMTWKNATTQSAPTNVVVSSTTISWSHSASNMRFSVYVYPKGTDATAALENSSYLVGYTYTKSMDISSYSSKANSNYTWAVRPFDRYGNEYVAGFWNNSVTPDPPAPVTGTVEFVKQWSKTQSASGYLVTGNLQRSMAVYEDYLYIPQQNTAATFDVINGTNGTRVATRTVGTVSGAWNMNNVAISADGQILFGSTKTGSNTLFLTKSDRTSGGMETIPEIDITGFGRSDYFALYADYHTASGGYLVAASNAGGKALRIPITNGTFGTPSIITCSTLPAGSSALVVPEGTANFYAMNATNIPALYRFSDGTKIAEFGTVRPSIASASGFNVFTFKGRKFMVTAANAFGSVEVFEITEGLANATKVGEATPNLGSTANGTATVPICSEVKNNYVMVYIMAPNNGIVAYKLTIATTDIQDMTINHYKIISQHQGIRIETDKKVSVQIYSINGMLLYNTFVNGSMEYALPKGLFLVAVDGEVQKTIVY
jgi:uncharacterized lipoprotein YddW (UPF0748 family)